MRLWAVAVTWPRYERRVERTLARHGFAFYLPRCKTRKQRTVLLFPRYLFVGPVEQWVALRQVYGISKLLRLDAAAANALACWATRAHYFGSVYWPLNKAVDFPRA
jgi:hypothetical protein